MKHTYPVSFVEVTVKQSNVFSTGTTRNHLLCIYKPSERSLNQPGPGHHRSGSRLKLRSICLSFDNRVLLNIPSVYNPVTARRCDRHPLYRDQCTTFQYGCSKQSRLINIAPYLTACVWEISLKQFWYDSLSAWIWSAFNYLWVPHFAWPLHTVNI